jgi:hypothetical protein
MAGAFTRMWGERAGHLFFKRLNYFALVVLKPKVVVV